MGRQTGPDQAPLSDVEVAFWDDINETMQAIIEDADLAVDLAAFPQALLLLALLENGSTYTNQMIVRVPDWMTMSGLTKAQIRQVVDLAPSLSHIKADNLLMAIKHGTLEVSKLDMLFTAVQGVAGVSDVWTENWDEYQAYGDTTEQVSAMAVDAGLALVPPTLSLAGGVAGAWAGAALGTAVGGPVGLVVGAAFGFGLGYAGDYLGGQLGEMIVDSVEDNDGRDELIHNIDDQIVQPIADEVNDLIEFENSEGAENDE